MNDRCASVCVSSLNEVLSDNRTCHGCAEEVLALINGICFQSREYEVGNKLFGDIFDDALDGATLESFFLEVIVIDTYADLTAVCNYFTIVVLQEPRDDDGCIQSA